MPPKRKVVLVANPLVLKAGAKVRVLRDLKVIAEGIVIEVGINDALVPIFKLADWDLKQFVTIEVVAVTVYQFVGQH